MSTTKYIIVRKPHRDTSGEYNEAARAADGDRDMDETPARDFIKVEDIDERDVSDLRADPDIEAAPSVPISLVTPVGTEAAGDEEVLAAKKIGGAWGVLEVAEKASTTAGSSIKVAVLDTGIDADHSAFKGIDLLQKNFSASPYPDDRHGHGTHCAGTIFGRDVDGVRIGVARGVRAAIIGKVLDDNGYGNTDAIANGIQWAHQAGAQVISVSIGINFAGLVKWHQDKGKEYPEALSLALAAFRDTVRVFDSIGSSLNSLSNLKARGVVIVAAGGNDSARAAAKPFVVDVGLPAAALDTISVGAIGRGANGYQIAPFSNANPQVCAPGVDIVSARPHGGLVPMSGTSMAAPHVAGLSALWWERSLEDDPKASGEIVRSRLRASCRNSGFSPGISPVDRGAGLVRAPE